jgi:hypothetical protein
MNIMYDALHIPSALMAAANAQQDLLCRVFGRCIHGDVIDREVGSLTFPPNANSPWVGAGPTGPTKLFTYVRYNVDLTQPGLDKLGLSRIRASDVQQMDAVNHIGDMSLVGKTAATADVADTHFQGFP